MLAIRRLFLILCLALTAPFVTVWVGPAVAQSTEVVPDYNDWLRTVDRAERTILNNRASDAAFEDLRAELLDWRRQLSAAQTINAVRVRTVEAQLEALGPPPAEGETEPATVVEIRAALDAELAELRAPQRTAEVAFNRADALIAEIDQLLRQRQASALVELSGSPLLPSSWRQAFSDFRESDTAFVNELRRTWASPAQRVQLVQRLPATLFLLLLGGALVLVGRRWTERLTIRLQERHGTAGYALLAFVVSLGQLLIPLIGIIMVYVGAALLGVGGTLAGTFLTALAQLALALVAARWVAVNLFPQAETLTGPLPFNSADRRKGRSFATWMGLILGVDTLLGAFGESAGYSDVTMGFFRFPLILAGALVFFRLAQLMRRNAAAIAAAGLREAGSEPQFIIRFLGLLWRALILFAVTAPVFAVIGYANMAELLVVSPILSLGLIAFLSILHLVFRDIYALAARRTPDEAREALVPVLLTLVVTFAALPVLALIWGVRAADIAEVWSRLAAGVRFGETRIGITDVLTIALVFAIGFGLTRLFQATLRTAVLPRTNIDAGGRNAITAGVGYIGITVAAVAAITVAGVDLTGFALIASALSVGIGFGLQTIVSNFVSGLILLAERPIGEGDWIEVNGQMGIVKDISVRATVIETFDRTDLIIPNGDLVAGTVTNWTRGNSIGRVIVDVGVGYDSDTQQVETILREVCEAHPLVVLNPPPAVFFRGFGDSALLFDARCIIRDVNFKLAVHSELNHEVLRRFREAGIAIPFPQRDVWLRREDDEPETAAAAGPVPLPPASLSRSPEDPRGDADGAGSPDPDD